MALKDQLKRVENETQANKAQVVSGNLATHATPARSYPSPTHTYEEDSQFVDPFVRTNTTIRPMWRVPDTSIQQSKINTVALPQATVVLGITNSPATTSTTFVAVPDMAVSVNAGGFQVLITWDVSASLSSSSPFASFALFRDGVQVGQTQSGGSPAAGDKFSITQDFYDKPPAGFHVYAVYWATSAGTLTADGKNRNITALVLRPQ